MLPGKGQRGPHYSQFVGIKCEALSPTVAAALYEFIMIY